MCLHPEDLEIRALVRVNSSSFPFTVFMMLPEVFSHLPQLSLQGIPHCSLKDLGELDVESSLP